MVEKPTEASRLVLHRYGLDARVKPFVSIPVHTGKFEYDLYTDHGGLGTLSVARLVEWRLLSCKVLGGECHPCILLFQRREGLKWRPTGRRTELCCKWSIKSIAYSVPGTHCTMPEWIPFTVRMIVIPRAKGTLYERRERDAVRGK